MSTLNIKILFITHYSNMYGANKSLCILISELKEKFNVKPIVLLRNFGPICSYLENHKIEYYIIDFFWWVYKPESFQSALVNFIKQVRNFPKLIKIYNTIKKNAINLVYTNGIPVNIGIILSRMFRCPHIWHIREKMEAFGFKFSTGKTIGRILLRYGADRYILISDFLIKNYANILIKEKSLKIYNGIPINSHECKSKPIGIFNICIIGILCEQKNQMDALQALNILINKKNVKKVHLHLIGDSKDGYIEKLKTYSSINNLTNNITFHGFITDLDQVFDKMHLGLVCAKDEAFGRVSLEFMLYNMPVIASNSGANPEIIKSGINGELYELNDIIELSDKINFFIKNAELTKNMGRNANEFVKANFSSENNTNEIFKVIKNVINIKSKSF